MTNSLPDTPDISLLKKQAKKLLKQFHENSPQALTAIKSNHPNPEQFAGLRDAQLVIARIHGFSGWSDLKQAVQLAHDSARSLTEKVSLFIKLGCLQYNNEDRLRNHERARRLLMQCPDIAHASFYAALVANNEKVVSDYLKTDPLLAVRNGGPLNWPALLYVTFSRVGEPDDVQDSVGIVKQLLNAGASPDSHVIMNDTYRFTALTGAMGEGEKGANQPPHQHARQLATLLLEAGASPNEGQGLYNTMFTDSADSWLQMLLDYGLKPEDRLNWNATGDNSQTTTLDYQLSSAVSSNRLSRVNLLLDAGADPNARCTYNGKSLHTNAVLAGHTTIAEILSKRGAISEDLEINDQFRVACVNADDTSINALLESHPELKQDGTLLHAAAEHASIEVVTALVAKGFNVNALSTHGKTLLHHFALIDDVEKLLIILNTGAEPETRDTTYDSTAAFFAAYSASYNAMRLLLDWSHSLLDVISCAYIDRAKILVKHDPTSVKHKTQRGNTVLHVAGLWLHDEPEYDEYRILVDWLVSAGADIHARNRENQTPIQFHLAHGSETLADVLTEYS